MKQAACVIYYNTTTNCVLATNRRGSFQIGLPGGKVDDGEDYETAAIREFMEETGIQLYVYAMVHHQPFTASSDDEFLTKCFIVETNDHMLFRGLEKGIFNFWVSLEDLMDPENTPFADYNREAFKFFKLIK